MSLHAYVGQCPTGEIIVQMYEANFFEYQRDPKSYKIRTHPAFSTYELDSPGKKYLRNLIDKESNAYLVIYV